MRATTTGFRADGRITHAAQVKGGAQDDIVRVVDFLFAYPKSSGRRGAPTPTHQRANSATGTHELLLQFLLDGTRAVTGAER